MSQKFIALLGVVQTILLLVLLINISGSNTVFKEDVAEPATAIEKSLEKSSLLGQPLPDAQPISEKRLRQIVREEVSSQIREYGASLAQPSIMEEPDPVSAAEYQYRYKLAMQELDYYLKQGEISDADMANLQLEISRLDPERRTQMLFQLTEAINSGELRGRF